MYKGGKHLSSSGYLDVLVAPCRYKQEHRIVMENEIGRKLLNQEVVHHVNGIRSDNRIGNLILFKSNSEHLKHHWELRKNKRDKIVA